VTVVKDQGVEQEVRSLRFEL
jgi:hypothetical protein